MQNVFTVLNPDIPTIFDKIIKKEIKTKILYEDELV